MAFQNIVPFVSMAHEHYLINYAGIYVPPVGGEFPQPARVFVTPGIEIEYLAVGRTRIWLVDKLPILPQVLDQNPTVPNLTCIDEGFGSTLNAYVNLRIPGIPVLPAVHKGIAIAKPKLQITTRGNQVYFDVATQSNETDEDLGYSFKIEVTGVLAKNVPGLGNLP